MERDEKETKEWERKARPFPTHISGYATGCCS